MSVTLFAYSLFVLLRLSALDFDATAFIVAGDAFVDERTAPKAVRILENSGGYDGQFFFRLSLDPFTTDRSDFGIELDDPPRRQQRILYPLIVWALSGGDPNRASILLIGVNLLALGAIGWLAGELARRAGHDPLWGLLLSFYPGFVLTLSRDLSEVLASAFMLTGIWGVGRARFGFAATAMTAAVLVRETTLLLPIAVLGSALLGARERQRISPTRAAVFVVPLLAVASWALFVRAQWDGSPFGLSLLGLPFAGIAHFLEQNWLPETQRQAALLAQFAFVAGTALVAALVLVAPATRARLRSKPQPEIAIAIAWPLYALLVVCLSNLIWLEDFGFLRAYTECYLLGALTVLGCGGILGTRAAWGLALALTWTLTAAQRLSAI